MLTNQPIMLCVTSNYRVTYKNEVKGNTMKKITTTLIALITSTLVFSTTTQAVPMDTHIESALIKVCKSALSDNITVFNRTTKEFNLKHKTVALKVMCNGDDIITFAEKNGAFRTAEKLEKSIGHVNIQEIAAIEKTQVTLVQ